MIKVATIIKAVGLKGELKVWSDSDFIATRFKQNQQLFLENLQPLCVEKAVFSQAIGRVKFFEINDRNQAEKLVKQELFIYKKDLQPLDHDQYYFHQLLSLEVYNNHHVYCGKVVEVLDYPASIVLRVLNDTKSFLIPFVKEFIQEVDLNNQKIIIIEMEGLR